MATVTPAEEINGLIINEINLVSPDRNAKDAGKLKASIERAESIDLPNRYRLYDLYHDVLTIDGHLSGIINKRTSAVANKRLKFVAKDGKKVDALDELIASADFSRLVRSLMDQRYWGCTGFEFVQGKQFSFYEIPRKNIRPEKKQIAKSQYDYEGISYADMPYIWVIGQDYDLGRLLQCCLYAVYKRGGFGDFAQFVEIFGQPVRIIRYDAYDTKTQQECAKILKDAGSSLAMMIPKQAEFDMLDGKTSNGDGKLQISLIEACNKEMSIAILGNTETTTSSSSSGYAQSQTHQAEQYEITKDDMVFVSQMLNSPQFLSILAGYGYPVSNGHFEYEQEANLASLKDRLLIDVELAKHVPIDDDYWYHTYGVSKPENYAELKKQREEPEEPEEPEENEGETDKKQEGKKPKPKPANQSAPIEITRKEKDLLSKIAAFFFGGSEQIDLAKFYGISLADSGDDTAYQDIYTSIARQLLAGQLPDGTIPTELYEQCARDLIGSINQGLGGTSFDFADSRNLLKSALTRNIYQFSAAKSLTELLEFRNLMYDKKTKEILQFYQFRALIAERGKPFNSVWLETEYDTALSSAISAHKWDTLQADYLEYSTVGDNKVRKDHKPLDGKTYPKSHPFWDRHYPPIDWRCRCTAIPGKKEDDYSKENQDYLKELEIPPMFAQNVGKTRVIFNDKHPYYASVNGKATNYNWAKYGLRPSADLSKNAQQSLPKTTADEYADYLSKINQELIIKDRLSISIKAELSLLQATEPKIGVSLPDALQNPTEMWDNSKSTYYARYYKDSTIIAKVNNKTLDVESITEADNDAADKIRKGILKHRAK